MNKFKSLLMAGLLSVGCLNAADGSIDMLQSIKDHNFIMPAATFAAVASSYYGDKRQNKIEAHISSLAVWTAFYISYCKNKSDLVTLMSLYAAGTVAGGLLHLAKN